MAVRQTIVRGGITLAVLAGFAGAMVVAPAGAHVTAKFGHLKKHIKKIAATQAGQVFDSKIGPATAPLQAKCQPGAVLAMARVDVSEVDTGFPGTSDGVELAYNCKDPNNTIVVYEAIEGHLVMTFPGLSNTLPATGQYVAQVTPRGGTATNLANYSLFTEDGHLVIDVHTGTTADSTVSLDYDITVFASGVPAVPRMGQSAPSTSPH